MKDRNLEENYGDDPLGNRIRRDRHGAGQVMMMDT